MSFWPTSNSPAAKTGLDKPSVLIAATPKAPVEESGNVSDLRISGNTYLSLAASGVERSIVNTAAPTPPKPAGKTALTACATI